MNESPWHVRLAHWPGDEPALRQVRERVFVQEQQVPLELEWDGIDDQCLHMLAEDKSGNPIGTGRLLPDGHIGRMAVLREWRGRGVGSALLQALMQEGEKQGFRNMVLAAQLQAMPFYEKAGFTAEGEIFDDAGIPHRNMVWRKS
ncbi:GNAT family N-acetyltransferase [Thiolapillus brandeum]|uniref:Acetyltransferase n=1 Tax=Thiolapillus brandeum TaxID=1076588 RepID=A0A7U6GIW0_9GAMM|nr:GNAT family N-acetyltransferase [Thiolapillus brandeum]BAO44413.1 acetyltransferase [Thiolapillus brandeum]